MATAVQTAPLTVALALAKETKGTFVYNASVEDAPVTTLYIRKGAFPNGAPATIVLTVA